MTRRKRTSLKVVVVSDLHFEFFRDTGKAMVEKMASGSPKADAIIVAGDLCSFSQLAATLALLCARFRDVVYVPGNHEYYCSSFGAVKNILAKASRKLANLHVLDNRIAEIRGVRFVGTTLWFPYAGPSPSDCLMNDFEKIQGFRELVADENAQAVSFLRTSLGEGDVVITHQLPSPQSISPLFAGSPLNPYFVCDVEGLIKERRPRLWIHGHTHVSMDYRIGPTRVICNPLGYHDVEENPGFLPDLVLGL